MARAAVGCRHGDGRHHAGDVFGLPEHFVQRDLAALPLDHRHVDLPHGARHSGDSRSTVAAVVMIWPAFAWLVMRLAVCTVAPNTSRFSSTTGPKWQPMRIATACPSTLSCGVYRNLLLHLRGGIERVVRRRERRHDLVAHRLDDRALVLLRWRCA